MSDSTPDRYSQNVSVEIDAETAEGTYVNLTMIAHSPEEFILDFIRVVPGSEHAKVKSRVILTPQHAKRLLRALKDNLDHYEEVHGSVEGQGQPQHPQQYFGGFGGEA